MADNYMLTGNTQVWNGMGMNVKDCELVLLRLILRGSSYNIKMKPVLLRYTCARKHPKVYTYAPVVPRQ